MSFLVWKYFIFFGSKGIYRSYLNSYASGKKSPTALFTKPKGPFKYVNTNGNMNWKKYFLSQRLFVDWNLVLWIIILKIMNYWLSKKKVFITYLKNRNTKFTPKTNTCKYFIICSCKLNFCGVACNVWNPDNI